MSKLAETLDEAVKRLCAESALRLKEYSRQKFAEGKPAKQSEVMDAVFAPALRQMAAFILREAKDDWAKQCPGAATVYEVCMWLEGKGTGGYPWMRERSG